MNIELFKLRNNFLNTLKLNSLNNTDDCINEWEFLKFSKSLLKNRCICGQPIKKLFIIKNLNNGNKLMIGKDCIKKFMVDNIILQAEINKIEKACNYIKNFDNTIFDSGKYKNLKFLEVYNLDKNYINFIIKIEFFKNPIMRQFKNYILYKNLLEL